MNDTQAEIVRLVTEAARKPVIRIVAGEIPRIATEGERAVIAAESPIYRRGSVMVRPVIEKVSASDGRHTHVAQFARIESAYLRDVLARVAGWERFDKRAKNWLATDPPHDVAATILARYGEWEFLPVAGILATPTLRPDGSVLSTPGYDAATRLILADPPTMPAIPERPTRDDALAALAILEVLLEEFPLVDKPSASVALSMLITPVVRGAFAVAPMHVARAPSAGSGKSFLCDLASAIVIGQPCPVVALGRDEAETEKRLGAALLDGQEMISLDNVNGELSGDFLSQAVERPIVSVRILGRSERVKIEARGTTFFATGNNLVMVGDMVRRTIVATLDPKMERPELREFTGNPVAAVTANRGKYIAACLCICRAYIVAGRPNALPPLASFEGWSDTVRSALVWLGKADPVETMASAREEDPELVALGDILAGWIEAFGADWKNRHTVPEVLRAIEERTFTSDGNVHGDYDRPYRYPELRDAILAISARSKSDAKTVGKWLRRNKGRIVAGKRFDGRGDDHGHAIHWWVTPT